MMIRTPASMSLLKEADSRKWAFSPVSWTMRYLWPSFTIVSGARSEAHVLFVPTGLVTALDMRKKKTEPDRKASCQANGNETPRIDGDAPRAKKKNAIDTNASHEKRIVVSISLVPGADFFFAIRKSLVGWMIS